MAGPGGPTVGRVNIRVAPDTSRFREELGRSLERLERALAVNIPTRIDTRTITRDAIAAKRTIERQLSGITTEIGLDPDQGDLARTVRALDAAARDRTATVRVRESGLDRLRDALGGLGRALGGVAGIGAAAGGIASLGAGAAVAAAQVVQLGAALAPLAGATAALPAVAASAGAALATLQVGLIGVGDAVEAALEGDAEALAGAVEGLAPAARSAVVELSELTPALESMQRAVQQGLFAPLEGELTRVAEVLLPTLREGMVEVAGSLGDMGRGLTSLATAPRTVEFLDAAFSSTAAAIDNAAMAVPNLLSGLTAIGIEGLPYVERLGAALTDATQDFQDWAIAAAEGGRVTEWIDGAIATFSQLGDIAGNVGGILGSVLSAAGDGGILDTIEALTGALDDFLASAEGVEALEGVFAGLSDVGSALAPVITALVSGIGALAPAVGRIAEAFGPVLTSAIDGLVPALAALEPGITAVIDALGQGIDALIATGGLEAIGTALSDILIALAPLLPLLGELAGTVLVLLADVLTALAPGLETLTTALVDALAPVLPELSEALTALVEALAPLIPALVEALLPVIELLPELLVMIAEQTSAWASMIDQLMPAIEWLVEGIGNIVAAAADLIIWLVDLATSFWEMAGDVEGAAAAISEWVGDMADAVADWFGDMRDGAADAVSDMVDRINDSIDALIDLVVGGVRDARDGAVEMIGGLVRGLRDGVGRAVDAVASLPRRIREFFGGARDWLVNAGKNVIYGLIEGIQDAAALLWDRMAGIAQGVRDYWPFSPARVGPLRSHPMDQAGENLARMLAEGMRRGESLVTAASHDLAASVIQPTLGDLPDTTVATTQGDMIRLLEALLAEVATTGGDIVLQVDSQEIARAAREGDRLASRR
ncbi:hypothetical protein GCM10027294_25710 [Marinactinospora endophytica]